MTYYYPLVSVRESLLVLFCGLVLTVAAGGVGAWVAHLALTP